jgi:RimJ/RimL family protein N-acetyltransferase
VIDTARLRLRLPHHADASAVVALMTDPETARWNAVPAVVDLAAAIGWLARTADWSDGDHASWAIADPATDEFLGVVSVHSINPDQRDAEIGYRVVPAARGRGIATEAVTAATAWAFENLDLVRIELAHAVDNAASCRVATHAGYQLEGTMRQSYVYGDGKRYDEHLHARLIGDPAPVTEG